MTSRSEDPRLIEVTKICLELPDADRNYSGHHAAFSVRAKIFAYFLNDHHGDGIAAICCKVAPWENKDLINIEPSKFYSPAYIGPKGWVGLRLDIGPIDWVEVTEFIVDSYRQVAPKKLLAQLGNQ
jgi:predicted DNA-binding protein (MmcQ/YjbR family)